MRPPHRQTPCAQQTTPRWLAISLAALLLAVGCGKDPGGDDADATTTDVNPTASDSEVSSADSLLDAAIDTPSDTGATTPCSEAGAPAGSNLRVRIEGGLEFKDAFVRLDAVAAGSAGLSMFRVAAAATLYDGPLTGPPMDWRGVAPIGTWVVRAIVTAKQGDMETSIGGGISCGKTGIATVEITTGGCSNAVLPLATDDRVGDADELCGGAGTSGKGLFKPISTVITPPTQAGGAHLMNGQVIGERLWVAASQDGVVSFDFPATTPSPAPTLNNWQVHGQAPCNRLHRAGATLFCTSRRAHVGAIAFDPKTLAVTGTSALTMPKGAHGEGMAHADGRLYVAAHGAGIVALQVAAPHALMPMAQPTLTLDPWDVATQGKGRLVIANGGKGVVVLDGGGSPEAPPPVLGALSLPGVAAFLAVQGDQLAVGALNGGLHVMRLKASGEPMLQGSFTSRGLVYGVAFQGDLVLAAAGSHLLAVDRPQQGKVTAKLVPRGLTPSFYHAMDVEAFGAGALASEFQGVRLLQLDLAAAKGPLLEAPMHVMAPLTAVGQPIAGDLRLRNAGTSTLHVAQILFSEAPQLGNLPKVIAKDLDIAPGAEITVPISQTKTLKGTVKHEVLVISDDPAQSSWPVGLFEIPELRPGDPLPSLAYKNAAGQLVDINKSLAGKVGVLMVAAHACPVSFLALAAAMNDLAPLGDQVAILGIDPWDTPTSAPETQVLKAGFTMLYSPLSTNDGHDQSEVLDQHLGQPILAGPPMPIVYIVTPKGTIASAQWGYEPGVFLPALKAELLKTP